MSPEGRPRLLVFARVPVPGRVKTRLIGALGEQGATAVHRTLLGLTLESARGLTGVDRELWWDQAPPPEDPAAGLAAAYGMTERIQQGADLGERMAQALRQTLAQAPAAVLIGSDCPGCDADYLSAAFSALGSADAVLGPAADGGYVLIGLRHAADRLFADLPWGSDRVLAGTRARLAEFGLRWQELPVRSDIDRPEDLTGHPDLLAAAGDPTRDARQPAAAPATPGPRVAMTGCRELLFVYNADSGLFDTLADIGHKLLSPDTYPCALCSLTHGYIRERGDWRAFLRGLPARCEFLHRDQFRRRWPESAEPLPAVFCLDGGQPALALSTERIGACESVTELMDLVRGLTA